MAPLQCKSRNFIAVLTENRKYIPDKAVDTSLSVIFDESGTHSECLKSLENVLRRVKVLKKFVIKCQTFYYFNPYFKKN